MTIKTMQDARRAKIANHLASLGLGNAHARTWFSEALLFSLVALEGGPRMELTPDGPACPGCGAHQDFTLINADFITWVLRKNTISHHAVDMVAQSNGALGDNPSTGEYEPCICEHCSTIFCINEADLTGGRHDRGRPGARPLRRSRR